GSSSVPYGSHTTTGRPSDRPIPNKEPRASYATYANTARLPVRIMRFDILGAGFLKNALHLADLLLIRLDRSQYMPFFYPLLVGLRAIRRDAPVDEAARQ